METQLQRIAKVAKSNLRKIYIFNTSSKKETLIGCHNDMNGNKASGIDD